VHTDSTKNRIQTGKGPWITSVNIGRHKTFLFRGLSETGPLQDGALERHPVTL
jgi:hypothetical protein